MKNMTFGDPCRSNGGSYDFGAIETFDQHAKIYKYTNFHPNRTGCSFPIGFLPSKPIRTSVTSVSQTVGPTTLGQWRLLISMQKSISIPIFIQIARGDFPIGSLPCPLQKLHYFRESVRLVRRTFSYKLITAHASFSVVIIYATK